MRERMDELRTAVTEAYEQARAALASLREADLDRHPMLRQRAAALVLAPAGEMRAAARLTDGKSAEPPSVTRPFGAIGRWRDARRLRSAGRRQLLRAWEDAFNEFFAFINDLSEEQLARDGIVPGHGRLSACQYLSECPAAWLARARALAKAADVDAPAT
jgi:hypothetical protein